MREAVVFRWFLALALALALSRLAADAAPGEPPARPAAPAAGGDWPVWRGPKGDGIVTDSAVPTKWSATENVVWKVSVPGIGHSSPVVSNGRVFLTSFDPQTNDRLLLCFDRADGKLLWQKSVLTAAPEK